MAPEKLFLHLFFILFLFLPTTKAQNNKNNIYPSGWQAAAKEMVQTQIVERGVQDTKVLAVMTQTARHNFVPPEMVPYAVSYTHLTLPTNREV